MPKIDTSTMAEPSHKSLRQIGRKALVSKFRGAALGCTLEFGLTADDINEVACQIARESEAYSDRDEAK